MLEEQIQRQELNESVWRFDKIDSMTIYFYESSEMNGSSYMKIPLRFSAILNTQNDDKGCFVWSIYANIHAVADSRKGHAARVSNYRQ